MGLSNMVSSFAGFFAAYIEPEIYEKSRDIQKVTFCMVLSSFLTWVFAVGVFFVENSLIKLKEKQRAQTQATMIISIQDNRNQSKEVPTTEEVNYQSEEFRPTQMVEEPLFTYKHVGHLEPLYWVIVLNFCFISMCMFQFTSFMTDLLMKRFNYEYLDAKNLAALMPLISMVLTPILSAVVQVIGKKPIFWTASSCLAIGCYWYLEKLDPEPGVKITVVIVAISTFYSLYTAVLYSSVGLVVPTQGIQVAYGLMATIQSIMLSSFPVLFGYINEARTFHAYNSSLFVLRMLGICALVCSILMIYLDCKTGKRLFTPENDPKVLEAKERSSERFRVS